MYRPCAPDGFIPNSVVREFYSIKSCDDLVVKEEWKPPVWRPEWDKISQGGSSSNEGGVRHWLSDDDDDETPESDISNNNNDTSRRHDPLLEKSSDAKLGVRKSSGTTLGIRKSSGAARGVTKLKSNVTFSSTARKSPDPPHDASTSTKDAQHHGEKEEEKETNMGITEEEDNLKSKLENFNEEQNVDGQQLVPYPVLGIPFPFLEYINESWFPKDVGYDIPTVIGAIIGKLETAGVGDLNKMLQCVIKTHRYSPSDSTLMDNLLTSLFVLLNNNNSQIRHTAVRALRELGINQSDVIMHLIPKLEDPSREVRDEVKMALKEIAGIIDAATLTSTLKKLGRFKDVEVHDNDENNVLTKEEDSCREESTRRSTDSEGRTNNMSSGLVVDITMTSSTSKLNKQKESLSKEKVSQQHDENDDETKKLLTGDQGSQYQDDLSSRTEAKTEDLLSDNEKDKRNENKHRRNSSLMNSVPGVLGERILSGIHMLPDIKNIPETQHNRGVIKPIPERHGCATVKKEGYTYYGKIGYQWTTYTSEYDMGISNHGNENRRDNDGDGDRDVSNRISRAIDINNTKTFLPSIRPQSVNKYDNIYIY